MDTDLFTPAEKRKLIVYEWRTAERPLTRAVLSVLKELPDWELILLRTKPLSGRPSITPSLRDRVHVRTALSGAARAPLLNETAIFVPGLAGLPRLRLEAQAAGAAIASPPGVLEQPALAAAALARLAEDDEPRTKAQAESRELAADQTFEKLGRELDELYGRLARRKRSKSRTGDPLSNRPGSCATSSTSWSHDCLVEPAELVDHAEEQGLGAIAVTDHNAFGGALQAAELQPTGADGHPGRGDQDGRPGRGDRALPPGGDPARPLVRGHDCRDSRPGRARLPPHPFDRMHAIPDAATLHRHLADIDVFEVYNARLSSSSTTTRPSASPGSTT